MIYKRRECSQSFLSYAHPHQRIVISCSFFLKVLKVSKMSQNWASSRPVFFSIVLFIFLNTKLYFGVNMADSVDRTSSTSETASESEHPHRARFIFHYGTTSGFTLNRLMLWNSSTEIHSGGESSCSSGCKLSVNRIYFSGAPSSKAIMTCFSPNNCVEMIFFA